MISLQCDNLPAETRTSPGQAVRRPSCGVCQRSVDTACLQREIRPPASPASGPRLPGIPADRIFPAGRTRSHTRLSDGSMRVIAYPQCLPQAPSMARESKAAREQRHLDEQVDAVLAASRVLVGVSAQSIAAVEDSLTVVQFRALVIVASRGPIHLSALADAMRVHPSNATRTCDRLVADGLLDRRENPHDRRHLALTLNRTGPANPRRRHGPPPRRDHRHSSPDASRRPPPLGRGAHPVRDCRRRAQRSPFVVAGLDH